MRLGRKPAGPDESVGVGGLGQPEQVFFVLNDSACPYLPGQRERKLITELAGPDPTQQLSELSRAGFRRSHNFAYRPACTACRSCVPVRIPVRDFVRSRSQKRVWQANEHLDAIIRPARATLEQYRLFSDYVTSRHRDGEMAGMTFADYRAMTEHGRVETRLVEFRERNGRLAAACLADWLDDGPSAVYSFYDPACNGRSLGTYVILWLIQHTRARGLSHVYLGYWIANSSKMSYKVRFQPVEVLGEDGWTALGSR